MRQPGRKMEHPNTSGVGKPACSSQLRQGPVAAACPAHVRRFANLSFKAGSVGAQAMLSLVAVMSCLLAYCLNMPCHYLSHGQSSSYEAWKPLYKDSIYIHI